MSRFRAPSKTSARRNDGPSRPRSRQDGPRRQRSRQDGPNRRRSRPGRRLDARNQRQGHRNRDLPAAPPVRRRTAGQPPDLLARPKACRPRPAPPPCSTDRVWLLSRSGRRSVRTPGGLLLRRSRRGSPSYRLLGLSPLLSRAPSRSGSFPFGLVRLAAGHFPDEFEHAAREPIDGAFGLVASSTLEHRSPPFQSPTRQQWAGPTMHRRDRRYPHPRLTMRESRHAGEPRPAPRSKLGNVTPGRVRH